MDEDKQQEFKEDTEEEKIERDPPKIPEKKLIKGTIQPEEEEDHEPPHAKTINWTVFVFLGLLLIGLGCLYYVIEYRNLLVPASYQPLAEKIIRASGFSCVILLIHKLIMIFVVSKLPHAYTRYNFRRIVRLITFLLIAFVVISIVFVNWYAAAVSLGLISLILGFALQNPISSFIGWIYLVIKRPYKVGDRIEINDAMGDVIDVSYFDTTLWEFHGSYLSTDHPSGRLIRFPNSMALNSTIFNYSWEYFPYIWDEVKVHVAYTSDFKLVSDTMKQVVYEELGTEMQERVKIFKKLLKDTPIDCLEVNEKPSVVFKVHDNTWIEVICRYLVDPRIAGSVRSKLTLKVLQTLGPLKDHVLFPKGGAR